jgi:hypothetical protein
MKSYIFDLAPTILQKDVLLTQESIRPQQCSEAWPSQGESFINGQTVLQQICTED